MNLFWYYVTLISLITCLASAAVGLDGLTRKPSLLKIFSLNPESLSSACSSSINFFLPEFLNSIWRIWCFYLCWIHLDFLFLGGSLHLIFPFPSTYLISLGFWWLGLLLLDSAGWKFLAVFLLTLRPAPFLMALNGSPTCPWTEEFLSLFLQCLCDLVNVCFVASFLIG